MVSRQARQFAEHGYRVVIPDLGGTGDSHGEFGEATWTGWSSDLRCVVDALELDKTSPLFLWALRCGALLGLHAVRRRDLRVDGMILWSPCLSGASYMDQVLRMRLMSSVVGKSDTKESMADLKAELASGSSLEVAGYEISPELFNSIVEMKLAQLMGGLALPISWFELIAETQSALPPAVAKVVDDLRASGLSIEAEAVVGAKFWTTVETTVSNELAERTLRRLNES